MVKAFSNSPMSICRNISNNITSIRQAIDTEAPIQLSEWKNLSPNEIRAVLIKFIEGTLEYFSFKRTDMSSQQIIMIVNDIMDKYFYFRLEDVCLCFKKGRIDSNYRKFYGRVDGSVFLDWFAMYDKERQEVLYSHPSNSLQVEEVTTGVPWEEYRSKMIELAENGDEDALKHLESMENVRKMFDADAGVVANYKYNMKHRFDDRK